MWYRGFRAKHMTQFAHRLMFKSVEVEKSVVFYINHRPYKSMWILYIMLLTVFATVWQWQYSTLFIFYAPTAGLQVVPADIRDMKVLILRNNIQEFQIASDVGFNSQVPNLAMEHLYPARRLPNAEAVFSRRSQAVRPACKVVDVENNILLYNCSNK
jgi:hypothetical protein